MKGFISSVTGDVNFNPPHQPCDVGLGDPRVGGRGHVFSRASVLSGVAAAGLAVSLLTQGVREAVISGTWRQRDIQTWKEEEVTGKKRGNQHIS